MRSHFTYTFLSLLLLLAALPLAAQRGAGRGRPASPPARGTADSPRMTDGLNNRGTGNHAGGLPSGRIADHPGLSTQLERWLPPGQDLSQATAGFRNQGEAVSALHAAHNLDIPFDQLKSRMTGSDPKSLGEAIHELKPSLDGKQVKEHAKLAEKQAKRDFDQAGSIASGKENRIASEVAGNPKLQDRLTALLPPGTTIDSASSGFRNRGQFVATLEASRNLNVPFADLKDRVTAGQSLGDALHDLNPALDRERIQSAVKDAEQKGKQ